MAYVVATAPAGLRTWRLRSRRGWMGVGPVVGGAVDWLAQLWKPVSWVTPRSSVMGSYLVRTGGFWAPWASAAGVRGLSVLKAATVAPFHSRRNL